MALHTATFVLNNATVTVKVLDGYFKEGWYTNPYPIPLNFQVVDTSPRKGNQFFYTFPMKPFTTNEPIPSIPGANVEGLYAKIALARA